MQEQSIVLGSNVAMGKFVCLYAESIKRLFGSILQRVFESVTANEHVRKAG